MLKKLLTATVFVLLAFPAGNALAQQTGIIVGTVTDTTTSEPLPGVNVVVQGLNIGSATDADGTFRIEGVPVGSHTLLATFIGYEPKTIPISVEEGINRVRIRMVPQVIGLEDVVVTALGIEREARSIGYSVQEVEGEELARVPETNFIASLQGQISGAQIQSSNQLGGSTRIVLRGPNSISGNNQPLIVVDGIPINNANITGLAQAAGFGGYDYGNAAQILNPADIKSVSVLKGAAAAALYGSRAANGVIQITTKSGARTQGIGVTINTSLMAREIYGLPDYQNEFGGGYFHPFLTLDGDFIIDDGEIVVDFNGDGQVDYRGPDQWRASYGEDESWGPRLDGRPVREWFSWDRVNGLFQEMTPWDPHPNNVQDYFQTGLQWNTTVSFSQAGENFNYRTSLASLEATGTYPNFHLGRKQISFNGNIDLSEDFVVTVIANYIDTESKGRPGTGYDNANPFLQFTHFGHRQVDLGPGSYMRDYRRLNGAERGWNWDTAAGAVVGEFRYTDNPYWIRYESFATGDTERLFGKVALNYDFTDDVTLNTSIGTDHYTKRRADRVATGSKPVADYDEGVLEAQESFIDARLTYDGQLSDQFSLATFAATEYRYESYARNYGSTVGGLIAPNVYTIENSVARPTIDDYFQSKAVYSVYGSVELGWRDLLYLNLTGRNDWSSTLPAENNSYFYPGASLSFVFSALPVLQGSDVLSFGKLGASVARVGSDTRPYRLNRVFPVGTPFMGKPVQSLPRRIRNAELLPEITTSYEVTTTLQFFNNRVGLNATYYYEEARNQIIPVDLSRTTGYGSAILNAGLMTNQGLGLTLSVTPVLRQDLQWDITANWAKNVNEVVRLAEGLEAFNIGPTPFGPDIQARVGHPYGAIFGTEFVYDASGDLVLNAFGWPIVGDRVVLGSYQPDWSGGLSSTLSYKGFTASILFAGQKGGEIYSLSNVFGLYSGMFQETVDGHVRALGVDPVGVWFPDGPPEDGYSSAEGVPLNRQINPRFYFVGFFTGPHEMVVYDASYLALRELSIGYTFRQEWLVGTPIRSLTISAIGQNLATFFKNTPNINPAYAISAGNLQGFEGGQIPPMRSYGLSLRLTL